MKENSERKQTIRSNIPQAIKILLLIATGVKKLKPQQINRRQSTNGQHLLGKLQKLPPYPLKNY